MPFELLRSHEHEFAVYLPENLSSTHNLPVVIFLHGYGERGNDPWLPLKHIGHYCWQSQPAAAVVFPQCDLTHRGFFGPMEERVVEALNMVREQFEILPSTSNAIAGFSMGGAGALWLNARQPGLFNSVAAIAPSISWTGLEEPPLASPAADLWRQMFKSESRIQYIAQQFRSTKLLLVHGEYDDLVPIDETENLNQLATRNGAISEFVKLDGIGHEALEPALYDIKIFDWMLAQPPVAQACETQFADSERRAG